MVRGYLKARHRIHQREDVPKMITFRDKTYMLWTSAFFLGEAKCLVKKAMGQGFKTRIVKTSGMQSAPVGYGSAIYTNRYYIYVKGYVLPDEEAWCNSKN